MKPAADVAPTHHVPLPPKDVKQPVFSDAYIVKFLHDFKK
jgi:hypothetical protein